MGREEAGWGPKVRMRTFNSKKTRGATRILRRADGIGVCGQPKGSIEWAAREENVSLRGSIMRGGVRAEPSSYVNEHKLPLVGEKGECVANRETVKSGLGLMDGRSRWSQIRGRSEQYPNTCRHGNLSGTRGGIPGEKKKSHSTFLELTAFPDFTKGKRNEREGQVGNPKTMVHGRGRRGVNGVESVDAPI